MPHQIKLSFGVPGDDRDNPKPKPKIKLRKAIEFIQSKKYDVEDDLIALLEKQPAATYGAFLKALPRHVTKIRKAKNGKASPEKTPEKGKD